MVEIKLCANVSDDSISSSDSYLLEAPYDVSIVVRRLDPRNDDLFKYLELNMNFHVVNEHNNEYY